MGKKSDALKFSVSKNDVRSDRHSVKSFDISAVSVVRRLAVIGFKG